MATGLQARPQKSLMDMMMELETFKFQKEAKRADIKQRGVYNKLLGRQQDLAEKKFELLGDTQQQLDVARASGQTEQAKELKIKNQWLKSLSPEHLNAVLSADAMYKNVQSENAMLRQGMELSKLKIQQGAEQRQQMISQWNAIDMKRKQNEGEYDAIRSSTSGIPLEDGVRLVERLKREREVYGPENREAIESIYSEIAGIRKNELARADKASEDKEKRTQDREMQDKREGWSDWPPSEEMKDNYEAGSWEELDLAHEGGLRRPEVRYVDYDPRGWGWKTSLLYTDKTGITPPRSQQQKSRRKMTLKRAIALDLEQQWWDSPTAPGDNTGKWQPPTQILDPYIPDTNPPQLKSDPLGIR